MINEQNVKIGIVSVDVNTPMFNYGAILHTWAFEKFLRKNGFTNVETLDYHPESIEYQNRRFPFVDLLTDCHRKLSLYYIRHYREYLKKYKVIQKFISKEMTLSKKKYRYSTISREKLPYDILIAEDDVIWSPRFLCRTELVDKTFFLAHPNMTCRKIAYAPSMAQCNYREEEYAVIKKYLEDFEAISVREKYEKKFIEANLGINVEQCLDAVFLLEADEYQPIISNRFKGRSYILLYLPADDNKTLRIAAQKKAEELNLEIIEISNRICSSPNIYGDAGVEDFLSGIFYAQYIFTNSFHAICFSIIFQKQFFVFSRANAGKLKDICELFSLEKLYHTDENCTMNKIDYSCVDAIRLNLSNKARKWLLSALRG